MSNFHNLFLFVLSKNLL